MHNDDHQVGKILSRREGLKLLLATGTTLLGTHSLSALGANPSQGTPPCVVKPELTEGPYFADVKLNRSDIRLEPSTGAYMPGVLFSLKFAVSQIRNGNCEPLSGAMVNIWHCDAKGEYSAFKDNMVGFDTRDKSFLRGYQVTDEKGMAQFTTIFPGWYRGRAVHIHFKIRRELEPGKAYEFTSQLFFDEKLTDLVLSQEPYAAMGKRDTLNEDDGIYRRSGGQLMMDLTLEGKGYASTFPIALDLSDHDTGRSDGWRRRG